MIDAAPNFAPYEIVVEALRKPFLGKVIEGVESSDEYSFSRVIDLKTDWRLPLSTLAGKLLDAFFAVKLAFTIDDYHVDLEINYVVDQLNGSFVESQDQQSPSLPNEASDIFAKLTGMIDASRTAQPEQPLENVLNVVAELGASVAKLGASAPVLEFSISGTLTKLAISENVYTTTAPDSLQNVVYYLFTENLVQDLEGMSLDDFEEKFCASRLRTVIVVFDSSDFLAGDLLVICGLGHEDELRGLLTEPLSTEAVHKTDSALKFRRSESFGDFQTEWLTPYFFALREAPSSPSAVIDDLRTQLQRSLGLLSVLFLADYIEQIDAEYWVEYRGIGVVRMSVDRNKMSAQGGHAADLFQLYDYAFEGSSADKLEIVQQFISLITSDLNTLCSKAAELRDASQKTYATVLRNKVSVYFDTVNKIQERLKTAVDKSAESVISLSRDVSGDVYKVVGIIAAAISVALLKPDFGWPVALAASLVLAVYMAPVIFYHLQTLGAAYNLSMQQHAAYVRSFAGVLGRTKIRKFLADEHLRNAKDLFKTKQSWAVTIYTWCLVLSSSVAIAIIGYRLLTVK